MVKALKNLILKFKNAAFQNTDQKVNIIFNRPSENVHKKEWKRAQELFEKLASSLQRRMRIVKIEIFFEEPKSPSLHTKSYNTTLLVTPVRGRKLVAKTKNIRFLDSVHEAIEDIKRQEGKNKKSEKHVKI